MKKKSSTFAPKDEDADIDKFIHIMDEIQSAFAIPD